MQCTGEQSKENRERRREIDRQRETGRETERKRKIWRQIERQRGKETEGDRECKGG